MTTSVVVTPAGHHVRVTTIIPAIEGVSPALDTPVELAPGDPAHTFYVHGSISLKIEEYTPEAQPDGVTDADAEERDTFSGLPVPGYRDQDATAIDLVTHNKHTEERILRQIDELQIGGRADGRWLSIARTNLEQGFMALNRAIFKPARVNLPEDPQPSA